MCWGDTTGSRNVNFFVFFSLLCLFFPLLYHGGVQMEEEEGEEDKGEGEHSSPFMICVVA